MRLDQIKTNFHTAYRIAEKLLDNPRQTVSERLEADELRQQAAAKGWGAIVDNAIELLRQDRDHHSVTACWQPGVETTRHYSSAEEAHREAVEVANGRSTRAWNLNGALLHIKGKKGRWVR